MYEMVKKMYPICRSITGEGVRETLRIIGSKIPLEIHEVPTGTQVLDWTIPKEWNIKDAFIKDGNDKRVVDFRELNLHVMSYSLPVRKNMPLGELRKHIHTLPEYPEWVPYRTSYYHGNWGFCLSHNQLLQLRDEEYEVVIDSSLSDGYLTYGEFLVAGREKAEVLISTHICHPSLCNDNLSGISLSTELAKCISKMETKYSYRFVFVPSTIGSIAWLAQNEKHVSNIEHGLVAANLGDPGPITYKKSRRGNAEIDNVVSYVLKSSGKEHHIMDFYPYGYDERQYCSPGFNLPVGCLMRSPHGCYPEYHTSADNLDFVQPQHLEESLSVYLSVCDILESNRKYANLCPKGEPQLGKRGFYHEIGGDRDTAELQLAALWVLSFSDGEASLLDIAERSGLSFHLIREAAEVLENIGLLKETSKAEEGG